MVFMHEYVERRKKKKEHSSYKNDPETLSTLYHGVVVLFATRNCYRINFALITQRLRSLDESDKFLV